MTEAERATEHATHPEKGGPPLIPFPDPAPAGGGPWNVPLTVFRPCSSGEPDAPLTST
jgi:hypothetical protein